MFLADTNVDDYSGHLKNLLFLGGFVIAAIVVGIWWLKRNA